MAVVLSGVQKKNLAAVRKLLGADDIQLIQQGLDQLWVWNDPALWEVFSEGVVCDFTPKPGPEITKRVKAAFRIYVTTHVLAATGQSQDITRLSWSQQQAIERLEILTRFPKLQCLDITRVNARDFSLLAQLPELQELRMVLMFGLKDLQFLASLPGLKNLNVSHTKVTDFSPLAALTQLTRLILEDNEKLSDLVFLAGITQLTYLRLQNLPKVTDLSPLTGLSTLEHLELAGLTGVHSIEALKGLSNLKFLEIWGNQHRLDVRPLVGLLGLTELKLMYDEAIVDLRALKDSAVTTLNLQGFVGTSLESVSGLSQLQNLVLYNAQNLTDLSHLPGLTGLQHVNLGYCKAMTHLPDLSALTHLREIEIPYCDALVSLGGLVGLNLTVLNVSGCLNLPAAEVDAFIAQHPACRVRR